MPFSERRSIVEKTDFPVFGKLYLIILALRSCAMAGGRSLRPIFMTQGLNFSEDFSVMVIHSQMAGANIVMLISNILADKYSASYCAYVTQELLLIFFTYPLCIAATLGYLSLDLRRFLYLSGQGLAVLSLIGTGNINAFIAEQFSRANHRKYLKARDYITLVFTFLGVLIVPQLVDGLECFEMEKCYFLPWIMNWTITSLNAILFISAIKFFHRSQKIKSSIVVLMKLLKDGRKEMKKQTDPERMATSLKMGSLITPRLQKCLPAILYSKLYDTPTRIEAAKVWATWKFFLPISCFWALISQITTTWMFQANSLDGSLGFIKCFQLTILPNQVWGVIPLFGLLFSPILALWTKNVEFPLRLMISSQIAIALAFFVATYLEFYIGEHDKTMKSIHMYWSVPQYILASFSEITSILSFRLFNSHTVPRSMQQVSRNLLIISRALGNLLVVIPVSFHYFFDYPTRQMQFFSYPILLCTFIVVFTLMNTNFEWLLNE